MKKEELVEILKASCKTVNEGITSEQNEGKYPRIVYWPYIWEDRMASGEEYTEVNTYQVSFFSKIPRHKDLIALRNNLRQAGCHPTIYHEYNQEEKVWHSYFAIEVEEEVEDAGD